MNYTELWLSKILFDLKLAAAFLIVGILVVVAIAIIRLGRRYLAGVIEKARSIHQGEYEEEDE